MRVLPAFTPVKKKSSKEIKEFFGAEALKHPGRMSLSFAQEVFKFYPCSSPLDCMAGIGTTGLAALKQGIRNFVGVELDPRWVEVGNAGLAHRGMALIQGNSATFKHDRAFDLILTSPPFPNAHSPGKGDDQVTLIADLSNYAGTEYSDDIADLGRYRHQTKWMEVLSGILSNSCQYLQVEGHVLIHIKNYVKDNKEIRVDRWVAQVLEQLGLQVLGYHPIPLAYQSWFTKRHMYPLHSILKTDGWEATLACGHTKTYNPKRTRKIPKSSICVECGEIPGRVVINEERLVVARKV